MTSRPTRSFGALKDEIEVLKNEMAVFRTRPPKRTQPLIDSARLFPVCRQIKNKQLLFTAEDAGMAAGTATSTTNLGLFLLRTGMKP
jgi:hypothetical protein